MKKIAFLLVGSWLTISSCDKIEKPIVPKPSGELNESLFPGDWSTYPWPTFTENTNTNRNILLEDYTGHTCVFCPAAATVAAQLETDNPGRLFVASIHASPTATGISSFQELEPPTFVHDFTNPQGLAYGIFFANGFGFTGNPRGTVNRKVYNDFIFQSAGNWSPLVNTILTENDLKVNIQAKLNYYEETKGMFLHTEVDVVEPVTDPLGVVVYLIEEEFTSPQKTNGGVTLYDYHHHNVHRGNIDGLAWGRTLSDEDKDPNGNYYLDYSYQLPAQYTASNMHVLVYVYNKTTFEVYQVIKVPVVE
jgi:hypothetical protein